MLTDLNPVKAGIRSEVLQAAIAVVVVDMQRDFCKGGSLEVPGSENIIAPIQHLLSFRRGGGRV